MGALLSCSVEIRIFNNTQNITLKNPRTYFNCGCCSVFPTPELSPGSSDTCHFPGSSPFWGMAGILVYEAESFTLAIHFSNPIDYNKFPMELGLELSPGKAHLGRLEDTYTRMANGTYSSSHPDIKFNRIVVDKSHGIVQVSDGPIKVTASMSDTTNSVLRVVLEEEVEWGGSLDRKVPLKKKRPGQKRTHRTFKGTPWKNLEKNEWSDDPEDLLFPNSYLGTL
ncbi:hypothetical protein HGM15179_018711 [Zosterops borbonicus]|uniref:Uncharacterized protein n=1 Tax=Zosterops borbonicus TaxID=364589 RepID=A0A8K1FYT3_9PASS|nr:hypothetical protein HGM15179_018711 [Zosterops borbonicus]